MFAVIPPPARGLEVYNAVVDSFNKNISDPPSVATVFGYGIALTGAVSTLGSLRHCYREGCSLKNIGLVAMSIGVTSLGVLQIMSANTQVQPAMPEYSHRLMG